MSNLIPDAPPIQQSGFAPIMTESPSDAWQYEKVCLRPLPTNTFLDYRVRVDDATMDFYYHYDPLPGAVSGPRKWVCRMGITSADPNLQTETPGQNLYDTEQVDNSRYDAQASSACQDTSNAGYITKLACGENPSLPDPAKYLLWGIAGVVALVLLVWIITITSRV